MDADGAADAEADGSGLGVGVPVIAPPLPASMAYSRMPMKVTTVAITKILDEGSLT